MASATLLPVSEYLTTTYRPDCDYILPRGPNPPNAGTHRRLYPYGVENIWLIDPISRNAWVATPEGTHKPANAEFTVPGTPIRIALVEIFDELDDMLTQG